MKWRDSREPQSQNDNQGSLAFTNYEAVNKNQAAVRKTGGSKISDREATTSDFVQLLK